MQKPLVFTAAVWILLALTGCSTTQDSTESAATSAPAAGRPVTVTIPVGATGSRIGELLERAGVADASEFTALASSRPEALGIQPGSYQLVTGAGAAAALESLLDPGEKVSRQVVVLPGDRASEIGARLVEAGLDPGDVQEVLRLEPSGVSSVDGLLGPATYDVLPGDTAQEVVARMVREGRPAIELAQELAVPGVTARDLVVIASLLHAEVLPADWGKAARAIRNRLQSGMPLQLDSTAAYAAGVRVLELTSGELNTPSPYNTYLAPGLPAGPIGQVTQEAVMAAARPEAGPWLYWVTVNPDTGETRFSAVYDQFLRDKAEYKRWLDAQ